MIDVQDIGRVRTITINRPDKANSLTEQMLGDLVTSIRRADANVIILKGVGSVFSAGADLEAAKAGLATSKLWEELSGAVAASSAMTVAALNGTVAGGAMGMVLACDVRVAVMGAKFFYPVLKLGFLPQPSDPKRLAALAGPSTAKRILLGAEKLTAQEAHRTGLIDCLVEPDSLDARVAELTQVAAVASPDSIAGIKALF